MKKSILTIAIVLLSFISNSQTLYLSPNFYTEKVLDSLSIPYLPIGYRVLGRGYSEKFKKQYTDFFGNTFDFIPQHTETDITFKEFFQNKKGVNEIEEWFIGVMSNTEVYVIGSFSVPISHKTNKSILILETYTKLSDSYETLVFFETKDDKFYVINENIDLAFPNGWTKSYK
jgi:hypothetical protein